MKILYIDIDSLRPDHLGCYGYQRPLTPTMDAGGRGWRKSLKTAPKVSATVNN